MSRKRFLAALAAVFSLCLLVAGCAMIDTVTSSLFMITPEQEATMGKKFSAQIEQQVKIYDKDPAATAYINNLGQRLAKASPQPCEQKFTFQIVDSEEVNAFAVPGGYCYVQVGLIRLAKTEAELASVMAHEIGHVTARHGPKDLSRNQAYDLAGQLALGENSGALAQTAAAIVKSGVLLKHSRVDEFEADSLAVKTLARAGLNPKGLTAFFQQMDPSAQSGQSSKFATLLSTHPPTGERIDAANQVIQTLPRSAWRDNSPEFQALKQRFPSK
jgi:predicted Zn-dependent protease